MLQCTVPEASCNKVHLLLLSHRLLVLSRVITMVLTSEKLFSGRECGLGCGCDVIERFIPVCQTPPSERVGNINVTDTQ